MLETLPVKAVATYYKSQGFSIDMALRYINIIRNHRLQGLDRERLFTAVNNLRQYPSTIVLFFICKVIFKTASFDFGLISNGWMKQSR